MGRKKGKIEGFCAFIPFIPRCAERLNGNGEILPCDNVLFTSHVQYGLAFFKIVV